jgi:hypothetical protein
VARRARQRSADGQRAVAIAATLAEPEAANAAASVLRRGLSTRSGSIRARRDLMRRPSGPWKANCIAAAMKRRNRLYARTLAICALAEIGALPRVRRTAVRPSVWPRPRAAPTVSHTPASPSVSPSSPGRSGRALPVLERGWGLCDRREVRCSPPRSGGDARLWLRAVGRSDARHSAAGQFRRRSSAPSGRVLDGRLPRRGTPAGRARRGSARHWRAGDRADARDRGERGFEAWALRLQADSAGRRGARTSPRWRTTGRSRWR